ncbi:MAG TPA: twin-arginine translocase TatA/TatE family subunit [Candidatus Prevotella avicola]|uniref:Sec-independent protein translocase protein TatA n=1 Tax=Candidatus Prevotella avicola TaxID=2838738 RepID=A0A9D2FY34_9BACT|nr:twin-arginine translocase TatA/TatE family subunit [Candidatus Prevotella avicola]
MFTPLILGLGGQELLVILLIFLLLFGGSKIPELMKGLGKGVRNFKDGMNEVQKDLDVDAPADNAKNKKEEQQKE